MARKQFKWAVRRIGDHPNNVLVTVEAPDKVTAEIEALKSIRIDGFDPPCSTLGEFNTATGASWEVKRLR